LKRGIWAAAVAVLLATGATGLPASSAEKPAAHFQVLAGQNANRERERGWRQEECRFALKDGKPGWNVEEVKSTIRCAERKWSGALELGFEIVGCESGFDATNTNPDSSAGGVWQVLDSTWSSWRQRYADLMRWWDLRPGKLNGRTNAVLGWRVFAPADTGPWEASRWCWG
jgi:hypothetical protein